MNTLEKGTLHFVILKWGDGYLGICKELGFVEEWDDQEQVLSHLINGAVATLKAVKDNPKLQPSLNTKPPLKYLAIFYIAPILSYWDRVDSLFSKDTQTLCHA